MAQYESQLPEASTKETVLSFIEALNKEDFALARRLVHDDLTFIGALGTRNGADAYFADMERMKMKYVIQRAFVEGNDVCLLYDFTIDGITVFGCGWYQLIDNRIRSFKVIFDPRPLLEGVNKK
ncbi:nuclear transport factor 2 family protein [Cytophagaceae bacterium DM2B3-1]|uniref:Nuclear transport factor 2 family protein n=1 Tax=Xanthocytophaga flava TaxID=3048013 RepID=A0ABT7CR22_9BACT|nr:nuclear transport factor 2 family protein [Xanthocytophaga flavus]MDJ1495410.1 nuclear transport factor 2 family protein [Xanthocytophaga flavus]